MGRLGFNLVRQKEANKSGNVESGVVVTTEADQQQQNESNENVEIGELLIAIDKANRTIKNYRWLSMTLIAVIITLCGYIFITQARFHSQQSVVHALNKMHEEYATQLQALQGDQHAQKQALERSQSSFLEEKLQRELEETKAALKGKEAEAAGINSLAQDCSNELAIKNSEKANLEVRILDLESTMKQLTADGQEKEESLLKQVQQLQAERDELVTKVEATNRKLDLQKSESQKLLTTTTPRPRFFGSNQLKKLNDLMKDIESGAAMHDINGFMKKTDDVFGH